MFGFEFTCIGEFSVIECVDNKGKCQAVGSSGFSATVKGKVRKNCSCTASAGQGPIGIKCKG